LREKKDKFAYFRCLALSLFFNQNFKKILLCFNNPQFIFVNNLHAEYGLPEPHNIAVSGVGAAKFMAIL
jgi:hypothetical protein